MSYLSACWLWPRNPEVAALAMTVFNEWRVMLPYGRGHDPDQPIFVNDGLSLRQVCETAIRYDQGLLLCLDSHVGSESSRAYHKRPPEMRLERLTPQWRLDLEFVRASGARIHAVQWQNEPGYNGWQSRDAPWSQIEPYFEDYREKGWAVRDLVSEVFSEAMPLIQGGPNPRWHRNRHGRNPSLSWWLFYEHGITGVSVHFGKTWIPEGIGAALDEYPERVHCDEDVHYDVPDIVPRARVIHENSDRYSSWAAWFQSGWGPGENIGLEQPDGSLNRARYEQLVEIAKRYGTYRPDARPGKGEPMPPPGPSQAEAAYAKAENDLQKYGSSLPWKVEDWPDDVLARYIKRLRRRDAARKGVPW